MVDTATSYEWQVRPAIGDARIATLATALIPISAFFTLAAAAVVPWCSVVPPLLLLFFVASYLNIRQHLRDVVLIVGFVMVLYTLVPYSGSIGSDWLSNAYGREGGNFLHNLAITGYLIGVRVSIAVLPVRPLKLRADPMQARSGTLVAIYIGSIVSIALSLWYLSQFGFVIGGDIEYGESFAVRQQSGIGILLLSIPLAIATFSLVLATERRLLSRHFILPVLSFALLFIVHGQRKYFVIPLMLIGIVKIRVRGMLTIAMLLVGIVIVWVMFCYLGYLRTVNISATDAFSPVNLSGFSDVAGQYLAGETLQVLATASAAYAGVIAPLPHFGDYLLSWTGAFPQFLYTSTYVPVNVRFAYAWDARTAAAGQGWGFDFWGEAYIVGGVALVVAMGTVTTLFFRYLYVRSTEQAGTGMAGAVMIASGYYALWFQRNGIAYFVREFLVFQLTTVLLLVLIGKFMATHFQKQRASVTPFCPPRDYRVN